MPPLAYIAANAEGVLEGVPNCEDTNNQKLFGYNSNVWIC